MNLHGISTMTPMAQLHAANSPTSSNSTNSTSSTGSTGSTGSTNQLANQTSAQAESTFISLLVTELQSQDKTQPMDHTTMVTQMFSMNQLQQLIDINQTLTTALAPPSTTGSTGSTPTTAGASSNNSIPTGAN